MSIKKLEDDIVKLKKIISTHQANLKAKRTALKMAEMEKEIKELKENKKSGIFGQ
jgi:hypothetical protein